VVRENENRSNWIVVHVLRIADDEKVRIWDIERKKPYQVICDELERWGQITCIQWLYGFSENSLSICFGTGRGHFLIYQQGKDAVGFAERNRACAQFLFRPPSNNYPAQLSSRLMSL
jgi:hypothetical protein